jgi:site-specific recombinase XerD
LTIEGRTAETRRTYVACVWLLAKWCEEHGLPLMDLTAADYRRYFVQQLESFAQATARNRLLSARAFYRLLVLTTRRPDDPTEGLPARHPKREPRRPYTLSELKRLLQAAKSPRDRALVLMFVGSGGRLSEVLGIEAEDVDWERGLVLIRKGKGGKQRWVAPGRAAMLALRQYVNAAGGCVWRTVADRPVNRARGRKIIYLLADRAQLTGVHPHGLRVSFANFFLEGGGDLGALQVLMGHTQIGQTAYYAGFTAAQRALAAQRRLSPADRL